MRLHVLGVAAVAAGCGGAVTPPGLDPQAMPETIPCGQSVVIRANTTTEGIAHEREWLAKYYPGHGPYSQGMAKGPPGRTFEILRFRTREGRDASVCFDITTFFGRW